MKWLSVSALIIVTDQVTKYLAQTTLDLHTPVAVTPFLNLTLTYNSGMAFSLLSEAGGWQRWLFISLSIVISICRIEIHLKEIQRIRIHDL